MEARVGTRRKSAKWSDGGKKRPKRSRKPVHLTLDEQVWTLARQRFANVSRTVEKLLEVALGLEPSFELVLIPISRRAGSSVWESAGFASQRPRVQIPPGPPYSFGNVSQLLGEQFKG